AFGAELVDLMALGARLVAREVGDPDVALLVHGDAVRCDHHTFADVREDRPRLPIELEDWIERRVVAVDGAAAGGARAAPPVRPDVAVRRIDVDAGGRPPLAAGGKLTEVPRHDRRGIRKPLSGDWIARRGFLRTRRRGLRVGAGVKVRGR